MSDETPRPPECARYSTFSCILEKLQGITSNNIPHARHFNNERETNLSVRVHERVRGLAALLSSVGVALHQRISSACLLSPHHVILPCGGPLVLHNVTTVVSLFHVSTSSRGSSSGSVFSCILSCPPSEMLVTIFDPGSVYAARRPRPFLA